MASRSISAVRTWARNPGVGDEKGCVSSLRSPRSEDLSARWPPVLSAESPSLGCSRRLPEPLGFSSLLMAPYPDVFSDIYSNAEAVHAITRHGHDLRHFRVAAVDKCTESMTCKEAKVKTANEVPR